MPRFATGSSTLFDSSFNSLPKPSSKSKNKTVSWSVPLVSELHYDSKLNGLVWADILPSNPDALFLNDKNNTRYYNSKNIKKDIWTRFFSMIYNLIKRKKKKEPIIVKDKEIIYRRSSLKVSSRRSISPVKKFSEIIIDELERDLIMKNRRSRVIRKSCSFS
jgi:hypothetical protein